MEVHDLNDAFILEMQDMLGAEKQILKGLQKMIDSASNDDLKAAFERHYDQTERQIGRIEQAFEAIDRSPQSKHCDGIAGIIEEGEEAIEEAGEPHVRDAMLIASAQKVEHYEVATYGTLCTWGKVLGFDRAVELLKENLGEEKHTDDKLTQLSQQINRQAQPA